MSKRLAVAVAVASAVLLVAALPSSGRAAETVRVFMINGSFCNSVDCVQSSQDTTIHAGDTIEWVFADPACFVFDAVFAGGVCYHDAVGQGFGSGRMPVDGVLTFAHTFTTPGVYPYVCTLHAEPIGMRANIVVTA